MYLSGLKDLYSGVIVGYAMSESTTKDLVIGRCFAPFHAVPEARPDSAHRSRLAILRTCLPEARQAVRHARVDESPRQLLRQAPIESFCFSKERTDLSTAIRHARAGQTRHQRAHRMFYNGSARRPVSATCRLPHLRSDSIWIVPRLNALASTDSDRPQSLAVSAGMWRIRRCLRHLEEMMAERGISVDHSTVAPLGHQGLAGAGEGHSSAQESRRSELANG
ncbi:integrase catalytic subunit [Caballeronia arvi]|uniref:Integrase catalytic subunit n=1 Tax=Caballeronia arvi TaxID=1777135 RepID=A0A158L6L6_9BURK|nr:integrase catalytic subunit [Caballeronia arvi]